jgi:glycosyltransferase involved in cell wall biosynthesis
MIKVAYVALAPFVSGAERSLQVILNNARDNNIAPYLIAPPNSPMIEWAGERKIPFLDTDLPVFSLRNSPSYCFNFLKIKQWLKLNKIEIVHSNQVWSFPLVASVANKLGLVKVCHFRDPISEFENWWLKPKVDVALCISRYIENSLIKSISSDLYSNSITLINPVQLPGRMTSEQLSSHKISSREKLNLPGDAFVFGCIGQISEVKGVFETIQALSCLEDLRWHLVIAGRDNSENGAYLDKCKNFIKKRNIDNSVSFIGFIEDVSDFYFATDLVMMLSKEEPLGRVPLEAGGFYTPTLANKTGGLIEIIEDNVTGWLVDMNCKEKLLKVIREIVVSDISFYGRNAREYSESKSDPSNYMNKLYSVYDMEISKR